MSLMKWTMAAIVISLGMVANGFGQTHIPGPKFSPHPPQDAGNTRPFAEPGIFDYDGQMFAPIEFSNYQELEPNTGFYAVAERSYFSISRGGQRDVLPLGVLASDVPVGNDYGWGNRFQAGWMGKSGSGWSANYENSRAASYVWGQDYTVSTPFLVNTNYASLSLLRTFRQELSQGGYLEPYFGGRYVNVGDNTIEDTFLTPTISNRFKQRVNNDAIGGQVGARYFTQRGRFRYTFDGSVSALYNQQRYFATDLRYLPASIQVSESYDTNQSFVPVVDGRFELTYLLTRDIGIRLGAQIVHMWDGVARSDNLTTALNPNSINGLGGGTVGVFNEDTTAAGFSLGLEWRR